VKSSLLSLENIFDEAHQTYFEAEEFVTSALNAMSAHIAILDENGIILEVNKAWREFADSNGANDPTYGIGTNYLDVCDVSAQNNSEDAITVARGIRDVMGLKINEFYLEYPCHSPNERRWYVVRVSRFKWYGHIRVIVAHQNVTALKEVQIQLAESRAYTQAVLDNVVDGIVTVDEKGHIEIINPAAAQIFGYEPSELIGEKIQKLLAAQYRHSKNGFMVDFDIDIRRLRHEIIGQRKDGSLFPMYIAMSKMRVDNRDLYTGILQDITERKRLEAEVLEKERLSVALNKEHELRLLKDRFISVMSHELRTPLASIQLASDMLKKYGDRASEAEKRESIEAIETQVQYLSELVKDVLTISKTEFLSQELDLEIYDLETYLRDIIEELEWTYRKTHRLVFKGVDRRVEARLDRKLLRHAFTNLLTNAIKYSPNGGEVLLSLQLENGEAIIRVSDHGIGIPADDLPRLFEPFHRAGNVESFQGTGLGLAIAKQAVEAHGGTIEVESQVGVGTTFTIHLPLVIKTS
jgi:two-component system, LuxR family, sensor kinase FixL